MSTAEGTAEQPGASASSPDGAAAPPPTVAPIALPALSLATISGAAAAGGGLTSTTSSAAPPEREVMGSGLDSTMAGTTTVGAAAADADAVRIALDDTTSAAAMLAASTTKKEKTAMWAMLECGVSSEQGTRKTMEDQHKAMLASDLMTPRDRSLPKIAQGIPFFGVYDGHGGTHCAEFLRENLHSMILSNPIVRVDPERAVREAVMEAEEKFLEKCRTERIESGSTVAVALLLDHRLIVGNVGDSEIVLSRYGRAEVLTVKHSGSNPAELERVRAAGGKVFHNRVGHPRFNPQLVSLAVTRAVGDAGFKLEEFTEGRPSGVIAVADTRSIELSDTDEFIIIGCDGLWDVMSYDAAVAFARELVKSGMSTQDAAQALCQEALRLGSTDNVTAMIVNLLGGVSGSSPLASSSSLGARPASGAARRPASAVSSASRKHGSSGTTSSLHPPPSPAAMAAAATSSPTPPPMPTSSPPP